MERSSIKLMAAAMLISVMLTGCGDKNDAQSANGGQAANAGGQAASQDAGSGSGPQQPDRTADYFAKVVKVSEDAIIVQKSTMSPADMPSFGGGRQGQRPKGNQGDGGGGQKGNWQPPEGGANGGAANGSGGADGAAGQGGGRQGGRFSGGGFMNQMQFADEQVTVPVNADTAIVKFGRGQNGMTTDALKASDLKAGDILMVWVGTDNTTATYIRLQFNPAEIGGMPNRAAGGADAQGSAGNAGSTGDAGKAGNGQ